MSPEEAIRIITNEELYICMYNWFEDREINPNEIGINYNGGMWYVSFFDNDTNHIVTEKLLSVSKALDEFIKKMRVTKIDKVNLIDKVFTNDRGVEEFMERRLTKWNECKDRIFSIC